MKNLFEITSGTILGKEHRWDGKNNQDGFCHYFGEEMLIAVVCDGCSGSKDSEVGAKIGARVVTNAILDTINFITEEDPHSSSFSPHKSSEIKHLWFWHIVRNNILEKLKLFSNYIGYSKLNDFFLFTIVGSLLFRDTAVFFSFGDGVIAVNQEIQTIGPFPDNEPPYIAYGLTKNSFAEKYPDLMQFQIHKTLLTKEVQSFLIGTDGVSDLINSANKKIPGKNELVGPLSQFWEKDDYFENPVILQRKLNLINREIVKMNEQTQSLERENGHLKDDTTIIVGRRKKGG